jgi:hypothetical protein
MPTQTQLEIQAAARLARKRERERRRDAKRRNARRQAKLVPTLELLGTEPSLEWLARVAVAQARIRTAQACMSAALRAMTDLQGSQQGMVPRRDVRLALGSIGQCRDLLGALMPVTVCPQCYASDPACQLCAGHGVLTLAQASTLPPELLHDREL